MEGMEINDLVKKLSGIKKFPGETMFWINQRSL
jgi:hypothetical protein